MMVRTSKAFTLFELIIVVFLITIVGSFMFSSAIHEEKKTADLTPDTLPNTFKKAFKGQGDIELFCIKKCTECYIMKEGEITPYEGGTKFGKNIEIYTLDKDNHFVQQDELGRLKDEKINFRFHLYPNGSTTQMVVSNDKGIYFLPSFFGEAKKVEDMDEAKELWIKSKYDLKDSSSFY
jgi:hypothetical protein